MEKAQEIEVQKTLLPMREKAKPRVLHTYRRTGVDGGEK